MPTRTLADLMSGSRSRSSSSIYEPPDFSSGSSSFTTLMTQVAKAQLAQQKAAAAAAAQASVPSDGGFIDGGVGDNPPVGIKLPRGWKWLQTSAGHWYGAYDRGSAGMKELAKIKGEQDHALAITKITEKHPELKGDLEALPSMSVEKQAKTLDSLRKHVSKFDPAEAQMLIREVLDPAVKQNARERAAVESDSGLGTVWDYLKMGGIKALNAGKLMLPRSTESKMELAESYNRDIQSILENNAYIRNQEKLRAEGKDWFERTGASTGSVLSNVAAPIAEMGTDIGTVLGAGAAGSFAGSVVPGVGTALGGLGGAAAGLLARGTAAYNQGRLDFLSRVMADDRLSDEQKKQAIDGYGEYGEGALNAAIWTALPGAKLPGQVARATERKAVSALPKVTTDFVERSSALAASDSASLKAAMDWNSRNLASRYARSVAKTGLELEAYNTAGLLGGNAIYNAATGQDSPITEGLGDSILSTAGTALLFGIPGARRNPVAMPGAPKNKGVASASTVDRSSIDREMMSTEARKEAEAVSGAAEGSSKESVESATEGTIFSKEAKNRLDLLHDNLKGASAEHLKEGSEDIEGYNAAVHEAVESFYANGGTDAELSAFIESAALAPRNANNSHASKSQFPKKQISFIKSAMNTHKVVAAATNQNGSEPSATIDPSLAAAATDALNGKTAETAPSSLNTEAAAVSAEVGKGATPSSLKTEATSKPNEVFGTKADFLAKGWTEKQLDLAEGLGIVRSQGGGKDGYFIDLDAYNRFLAQQAAKKNSTANAEAPIGGNSVKVSSEEGQAGRVAGEGQNAPVEEPVAAAEGKSDTRSSDVNRGVEADGAQAAGAAAETAPVQTAGSNTGNQGERAGGAAVQSGGQNQGAEAQAVGAGAPAVEQRTDTGSGAEPAAGTDAAAGESARSAAGEGVGAQRGAGDAQNAGGNPVEYTWDGNSLVFPENAVSSTATPAESAAKRTHSIATAEATSELLSYIQTLQGNKSIRKDKGEFLEIRDLLKRLSKEADFEFDRGRVKNALAYVNRVIAAKLAAEAKAAKFADAMEQAASDDAIRAAIAAGANDQGNAAVVMDAVATKAAVEHAEAVQERVNVILGDNALNEPEKLDATIKELSGSKFEENSVEEDARIQARALAEARKEDLTAAAKNGLADTIIENSNDGNTAVTHVAPNIRPEDTRVLNADIKVSEKKAKTTEATTDSIVSDASMEAIDTLTGNIDAPSHPLNNASSSDRKMAEGWLKQVDDLIKREHHSPESAYDRILRSYVLPMFETALKNPKDMGVLFGTNPTAMARTLYLYGLMDRIDRIAMNSKALKFSSEYLAEAMAKYEKNVVKYYKNREKNVAALEKAEKEASETSSTITMDDIRSLFKSFGTGQTEGKAPKNAAAKQLADQAVLEERRSNRTGAEESRRLSAEEIKTLRPEEGANRSRTYADENDTGVTLDSSMTLGKATEFAESASDFTPDDIPENDRFSYLSSLRREASKQGKELTTNESGKPIPTKRPKDAESERWEQIKKQQELDEQIKDPTQEWDGAAEEARLEKERREAYEAEMAQEQAAIEQYEKEQEKGGKAKNSEGEEDSWGSNYEFTPVSETFGGDSNPTVVLRNGIETMKRIKGQYTKMMPTSKRPGNPEFAAFVEKHGYDKRRKASAVLDYVSEHPTDPLYDAVIGDIKTIGDTVRMMLQTLDMKNTAANREYVLENWLKITKDTNVSTYDTTVLDMIHKAAKGEPITPEEIKKARELCTAK